MSFLDDNTAYEAWLRTQCDVDEPGLVRKHEKMDSHPFPFLRPPRKRPPMSALPSVGTPTF